MSSDQSATKSTVHPARQPRTGIASGPGRRFTLLAVVLVMLNTTGWAWVRYADKAAAHHMHVIAITPYPSVDSADRLNFRFAEAAVGPDGLGREPDRPMFDIQPPVTGSWQWTAPDTLSLILDQPLMPSTRYTVKPAAHFPADRAPRFAGRATGTLSTPRIEALNCRVESATDERVVLAVEFNQPVPPVKLMSEIAISAGSMSRIVPDSVSDSPGRTIRIGMEPPARDHLTVTIPTGFRGCRGNLGLNGPRAFTVSLPDRFALLDARPDVDHLEDDIPVTLSFSRSIAEDQPLPAVTADPPVEPLQVTRGSWGSCLTVRGPFQPGEAYTLTLPPTLLSNDGRRLGDRNRAAIRIPRTRPPRIGMPLARGTLLPDGNLMLDLRAVNVRELKVRADRVFANNLASHLRGAYTGYVARKVAGKTVPLSLPLNEPTDIALDIREFIENPLGVYRIDIENAARPWDDEQAVVTVSRLAVTTRRARDGRLVWVTSPSDGLPVAGSRVTVYSDTNQPLADGTTDDRGLVFLPLQKDHPDGRPWLITAALGDDLNFLQLDRSQSLVEDADVDGRPWPEAYEAMIYTERGAYRPGAVMHGTVILRGDDGTVPEPFPLQISTCRPDGRLFDRQTIEPLGNGQGIYHFEIPTSSDGQLGQYVITARVPDGTDDLGETRTLVEAFVPHRLNVKATPTLARFRSDQVPSVHVAAHHLFDLPAAGLRATVECACRTSAPTFDTYPGHTFGQVEQAAALNHATEALLDARGQAEVELAFDEEMTAGRWACEATATVHEDGGRSVSDHTSFQLDAGDRYLGLQVRETDAFGGLPSVHVIAVSGDGAMRDARATVTLERLTSTTVFEEVDGRMNWRRVDHADRLWRRAVDVPGSLPFDHPGPGRYRMIVAATSEDANAMAPASLTFAWGDDDDASTDPETIAITFERDLHLPGETADVTLTAPFDGLALVTLETDRILDQRIVEVVDGTAAAPIPLPEDLRHDAYVSAALVRPVDPVNPTWKPHSAHGLARLRIERESHRIAIEVSADEKIEPETPLAVNVRCDMPPTDGSVPPLPPVVHVWAVDEGILSATRHATPDPFAHFLAARRAFVTAQDSYFDLLPDYRRPQGTIRIGAGDDPSPRQPRRSPVAFDDVAEAVIWSEAVTLDDEGHATIELDVPDMIGSLRIMAVVVSGDAYGSTARRVTVTSPLIVQPSWPRFAAPGDDLHVPVRIVNNGASAVTVDLHAEVDGPLAVTPPREPLRVAPGSSDIAWLDVTATGTGKAGVTIVAEASQNESDAALRTYTRHAVLPVRPVLPETVRCELVSLKAGETTTIAPPDGFVPGSVQRRLTFSPNPAAALRPTLDRLLDYPYGCVEQTSSTMLALLHARGIIDTESDAGADAIVDMRLRAGLARLASMQTSGGGLSYWPGGVEPHRWGTAYAGRVVAECRQSGIPVDANFVEALRSYLQSTLRDADRHVTDNLRALVCRTLATLDVPDESWMTALSESSTNLDAAARAHLAVAWLAAGASDKAAALLDAVDRRSPASEFLGRSFRSDTYGIACRLDALERLRPGSPESVRLASELRRRRRDGSWQNTLENASAFAALARMASPSAHSRYSGSLRGSGKELASFSSENETRTDVDGADELVIESAGEGRIHAIVTTTGQVDGPLREDADHGLVVRRRYLDRTGQPLRDGRVRVGELIRVEISIQAPEIAEGHGIPHVAIVDALPGGTEIENPNLATSAGYDPGALQPDRVQFLDDRVIVFSTVGEEWQKTSYALRVTTPGRFSVPPIQAASMYEPQFASTSPGALSEIVVRR